MAKGFVSVRREHNLENEKMGFSIWQDNPESEIFVYHYSMITTILNHKKQKPTFELLKRGAHVIIVGWSTSYFVAVNVNKQIGNLVKSDTCYAVLKLISS